MTAELTFRGWAILELLGHRRVAGFVTTAQLGTTALLKVVLPEDVVDGDGGGAEQFYSSAALYCLTPTTEDACKRFYGIGRLAELDAGGVVAAEIVEPWCPHHDERPEAGWCEECPEEPS